MLFSRTKKKKSADDETLPGRDAPDYEIQEIHAVLGTPMQPPFPKGMETAIFALGCFWGAEQAFWQTPGVYTTAAVYAGGVTPYPTYSEIGTGKTGHAESVLVVFDPEQITYRELLKIYWEAHDPTQVMRQGADIGAQYRSAIYYADETQRQAAEETRSVYQAELKRAGYGSIATEIEPASDYYYAEDYHQQYLHKVPDGYCGLGGTGVGCPIGLKTEVEAEPSAMPSTDAEWREQLIPEQYAVLRQSATEPPFTGEYLDTDDDGIYRCAGCGNPIFDSSTKFHSGSGWPSFTEAVSPDAVKIVEDHSHGMTRTEVRCARCDSHLGHVFDDGPREAGGERWCMNSIALDLDQNDQSIIEQGE